METVKNLFEKMIFLSMLTGALFMFQQCDYDGGAEDDVVEVEVDEEEWQAEKQELKRDYDRQIAEWQEEIREMREEAADETGELDAETEREINELEANIEEASREVEDFFRTDVRNAYVNAKAEVESAFDEIEREFRVWDEEDEAYSVD